jgi:polysaccharide deacetylase 2 family uncharacterized protein YibQ
LSVVVAAIAVGAAAGVWWSARPRPEAQPTRSEPRRTVSRPAPAAPAPQPTASVEPRVAPTPQAPLATPHGPRIALVFDDAGGSLDDIDRIIAIGRPVTVAVLPGLSYSADAALRARAAGLEVILHLPIASTDAERRLGPGAVTVDMDDATITATVRAGLDAIPGAIGANNHMGSAGTADRRVMRAILRVIKARGMFFLDSRTTAGTVVEEVAAEIGVRTARRALFLDNADDETAIREQVTRMITMAKTKGTIVAIGHAQKLTAGVVAAMLDELDREGVTLVPLSTVAGLGDAR